MSIEAFKQNSFPSISERNDLSAVADALTHAHFLIDVGGSIHLPVPISGFKTT